MTAAAIADDARDGGGTTSGTKEVERRREQPPRATPEAVAERSFGVVPQLSPIVTAERWQPLLNEVSRQTSVSLRFATASGITRFEERVLHGEYDYVYVNLLLFQQALKSQGYRALVRDEKPLRGIIAVRHDGPKSLNELAGKTLAFPAPRAFGATLLTRADLRRLAIPHDVSYLGTHESVYQSVAQGRHMAGGGVLHSFELLPAAQRQGLRILHTTAPVMAHVVAVHPRVPAPEAERVRQTLLKLHEQPVGAAQLGKLGMRRFVAVVPADFESVRGHSFTPRIRALAFHAIPRL
ncbi:MAG: phosphate/phosphite/phosphonate ABC transporter substrate-binding protein, partial [Pseudomonadota bacterium]